MSEIYCLSSEEVESRISCQFLLLCFILNLVSPGMCFPSEASPIFCMVEFPIAQCTVFVRPPTIKHKSFAIAIFNQIKFLNYCETLLQSQSGCNIGNLTICFSVSSTRSNSLLFYVCAFLFIMLCLIKNNSSVGNKYQKLSCGNFYIIVIVLEYHKFIAEQNACYLVVLLLNGLCK